jgi:hypothetical protein
MAIVAIEKKRRGHIKIPPSLKSSSSEKLVDVSILYPAAICPGRAAAKPRNYLLV